MTKRRKKLKTARAVLKPAQKRVRKPMIANQGELLLQEPAEPTVERATTAAPQVRRRRTRTRGTSPAGRRGLDCLRFLRIHARTPYGRRGQEAIVKIAIEAGHLGRLELAEQDDRDEVWEIIEREGETRSSHAHE